jgi:hypothetical protein
MFDRLFVHAPHGRGIAIALLVVLILYIIAESLDVGLGMPIGRIILGIGLFFAVLYFGGALDAIRKLKKD